MEASIYILNHYLVSVIAFHDYFIAAGLVDKLRVTERSMKSFCCFQRNIVWLNVLAIVYRVLFSGSRAGRCEGGGGVLG